MQHLGSIFHVTYIPTCSNVVSGMDAREGGMGYGGTGRGKAPQFKGDARFVYALGGLFTNGGRSRALC